MCIIWILNLNVSFVPGMESAVDNCPVDAPADDDQGDDEHEAVANLPQVTQVISVILQFDFNGLLDDLSNGVEMTRPPQPVAGTAGCIKVIVW